MRMRFSLQMKLFVSVVSIILLVIGVSTVICMRTLEQEYLRAIEWRAEALSQGLLQVVLQWNAMSPDALQNILSTLSPRCEELYRANKEKEVSHIAVINAESVIAAHNDASLLNTPIERPVLSAAIARHELLTVLDGEVYHTLIPIIPAENVYVGTIDIGIPKSAVQAKQQTVLRQLGWVAAASLFVSILGVILLVHVVVTRPLRHLIAAGQKIAQGEFVDTLLTARTQRSDDEIGELRQVFHEMIAYLQDMASIARRMAAGDAQQNIVPKSAADGLGMAFKDFASATRDVVHVAEELAAGNLSVEVRERSDDDVLMHSLNIMIQQLQEVIRNVKMVANNMATSSDQLSSSAEMMSEGASQQAAATEEVSASMEEMSANIRQNADNARQTEPLATQGVASAEESGRVVAEAVVAMQQIVAQISVIQDIALQTRLLSLNATIEASRAQDYGKSFGVVAHEVRELANTTKSAAEQIILLASSSLEVSQKAGAMLSTLVPNIQRTANFVREISYASSEQTAGVEQINHAVQQLDQVTQQNAASAEEVASSAEMLSKQAGQLQEVITFFKVNERAVVPAAEQDDKFTAALQALLEMKGEQQQKLLALLNTVTTETEQPAAKEMIVPKKRERSDASFEHDIFRGISVEKSKDALDDEFEHY